MTILVNASLHCNMKEETGSWCKYCYNTESRAALDTANINLDEIEAKLKWASENNVANDVCLHGGEPLSWGKDIVEKLFSICYRLFGSCVIQTNGLAIDDDFIKMFEKYNVSVGVSIDGLHPLNRFRCGEEETDQILNNIQKLLDNDVNTSIISTISKANGVEKHRDEFKDFLCKMSNMGLTGRLNPATHLSSDIQLTPKEAKGFYLDIAKFLFEKGIKGWSPYKDVIHALKGKGDVMCTFNGCNPVMTRGGMTLNHRGEWVRCHKFTDHYLSYSFSPNYNPHRRILKETDCKDCPYFKYCHGGCCADARNFDWRNKTRWCPAWKALWKFYEKRLNVMEVSLKEEEKCRSGRPGQGGHGDRPHGDSHGDHYDK